MCIYIYKKRAYDISYYALRKPNSRLLYISMRLQRSSSSFFSITAFNRVNFNYIKVKYLSTDKKRVRHKRGKKSSWKNVRSIRLLLLLLFLYFLIARIRNYQHSAAFISIICISYIARTMYRVIVISCHVTIIVSGILSTTVHSV